MFDFCAYLFYYIIFCVFIRFLESLFGVAGGHLPHPCLYTFLHVEFIVFHHSEYYKCIKKPRAKERRNVGVNLLYCLHTNPWDSHFLNPMLEPPKKRNTLNKNIFMKCLPYKYNFFIKKGCWKIVHGYCVCMCVGENKTTQFFWNIYCFGVFFLCSFVITWRGGRLVNLCKFRTQSKVHCTVCIFPKFDRPIPWAELLIEW